MARAIRRASIAGMADDGRRIRLALHRRVSQFGEFAGYAWHGLLGEDMEVSGRTVAEAIQAAAESWSGDWDFRLGW